MTINRVVGRDGGFGRGWLPELARPAGQRIREAVSRTGVGKPGEEPLDVAIAISPAAPGEQGQGITTRAAEVPGTTQADDRQKEQGQQQGTQRRLRQTSKARGRRSCGQRVLQGGDAAALVRCGQEQEAAGTRMPDGGRVWRGGYPFFSWAGRW